jgi:ferric-dicitrate binding protein FerR (iron transport regulator)
MILAIARWKSRGKGHAKAHRRALKAARRLATPPLPRLGMTAKATREQGRGARRETFATAEASGTGATSVVVTIVPTTA